MAQTMQWYGVTERDTMRKLTAIILTIITIAVLFHVAGTRVQSEIQNATARAAAAASMGE